MDENRDSEVPPRCSSDSCHAGRLSGVAAQSDVCAWLERAGLDRLCRCVITSVDAGGRKPWPQFFEYALAQCGLARENVLFIGNQLNADVAGGQAFGIPTCGCRDPRIAALTRRLATPRLPQKRL